MQEAWGLRERMDQVGRVAVRPYMPEQHRELFEKLPTLWLGTLDDHGQPWATVLTGARGFVASPDPQSLRVSAQLAPDDPAAAGLHPGAAVGLLGLEPHTRRRNRMNGRISAADAEGFAVRVIQSYGNCPKYIQAREPMVQMDRARGPAAAEGATLSAAARSLVEGADTLFIASSSAAHVDASGRGGAGVDVSHRGGPSGFVQLRSTADGDVLTLPDYFGNSMFNTLGNLLAWPRAGLLFIDWQTGDVLQLAVKAVIRPITGELPTASPVTRHWLDLHIEHGWWRPAAVPLRWSAAQPAAQFAVPASAA